METETGQSIKEKPLAISRVFNMPLHKMWKAWTDAETAKKWWGPKGFTCPSAKMDVRPGGKYLLCMRSPEGQDFWSTGVYKEVIPNRMIVSTDSFSDDKGNVIPASDLNMPGEWPIELLVTVLFEETDGKTKMDLEQIGVPAAMYEECLSSWQQSFDKLEQNLGSLNPNKKN